MCPKVPIEDAAQIYVLISSLALWGFFITILHCLISFLMSSQLNCLEELIIWLNALGILVHLHYFFFAVSFLLYVASQIWRFTTQLRIPFLGGCLGTLAVAFPLPLYATMRSTQIIYKAKIELAQMFASKAAIDEDTKVSA